MLIRSVVSRRAAAGSTEGHVADLALFARRIALVTGERTFDTALRHEHRGEHEADGEDVSEEHTQRTGKTTG